MRSCVPPLLVLVAASCGHWQPSRRADHGREPASEPAPYQGPARPPASQPTSQPAASDRAGLDALQRWTRECYQLGLRHDPVFAKGGQLLVRWQADRRGQLLFMDFAVDSFRGWAVNAAGETLADCVVGRAREAPVTWSRTGSAPFRLRADP